MSQHRTQEPHLETGGTVAVDLECINLVPEPDLDFGNPGHWSVFCIPVGYRNPQGEISTEVLFRHGSSICDERELIERLTTWIRDRQPAEIITFNGCYYDYPILRHRAGVTARECRGLHSTRSDLDFVIDNIEHTDLFVIVKNDAGYNVPLESALEYYDIPTEETLLNGEAVDGSSMPDMGVRILEGEATEEEVRAVCEYAESDVEPLFALYSCVCE